jgi:hypothetical protein
MQIVIGDDFLSICFDRIGNHLVQSLSGKGVHPYA